MKFNFVMKFNSSIFKYVKYVVFVVIKIYL